MRRLLTLLLLAGCGFPRDRIYDPKLHYFVVMSRIYRDQGREPKYDWRYISRFPGGPSDRCGKVKALDSSGKKWTGQICCSSEEDCSLVWD